MAELEPRAAGAKRLRDKVGGHWGRPGHAFLASDDASFITGQAINCSRGQS